MAAAPLPIHQGLTVEETTQLEAISKLKEMFNSIKVLLPALTLIGENQHLLDNDESVQYQSIYDQCTNALGLMRSVLSNPIVGSDQDGQIDAQSALCATAVMTIRPIAEKVHCNLQEERASRQAAERARQVAIRAADAQQERMFIQNESQRSTCKEALRRYEEWLPRIQKNATEGQSAEVAQLVVKYHSFKGKFFDHKAKISDHDLSGFEAFKREIQALNSSLRPPAEPSLPADWRKIPKHGGGFVYMYTNPGSTKESFTPQDPRTVAPPPPDCTWFINAERIICHKSNGTGEVVPAPCDATYTNPWLRLSYAAAAPTPTAAAGK